jgi:hypothetical protein
MTNDEIAAKIRLVPGDGTVVSASPLRFERASVPYRLVLRDLGHEYVTHMQSFVVSGDDTFQVGHFWGHYFQKKDEDSLRRAWDDFVSRTARRHEWDDPQPCLGEVASDSDR